MYSTGKVGMPLVSMGLAKIYCDCSAPSIYPNVCNNTTLINWTLQHHIALVPSCGDHTITQMSMGIIGILLLPTILAMAVKRWRR